MRWETRGLVNLRVSLDVDKCPDESRAVRQRDDHAHPDRAHVMGGKVVGDPALSISTVTLDFH